MGVGGGEVFLGEGAEFAVGGWGADEGVEFWEGGVRGVEGSEGASDGGEGAGFFGGGGVIGCVEFGG